MAKRLNLLSAGLSLVVRSWPALVWVYVFNLTLAFLFTLPLHQQLRAITAHSLASQGLAGGFDLGTLGGVLLKLGEGPGPATAATYFSTPIYLVLFFFLVPGTLLSYQTGAPARLGTLFNAGFIFFWRFVRIVLVTAIASAIVLGGLMALQNMWSAHVDEVHVGRPAFLLRMAGLAIVLLVAALVRLYFDMVEVYTVQLSLHVYPGAEKKTRQIRRAFGPAFKTLRHNFVHLYLAFVCLALLGAAAVVLTARIAMHSLAQPRMFPMFLLAQLGLFVMLLTRFWQRGAETALAQQSPLTLPSLVEPPIAPVEPAWEAPIPTPPPPVDGPSESLPDPV